MDTKRDSGWAWSGCEPWAELQDLACGARRAEATSATIRPAYESKAANERLLLSGGRWGRRVAHAVLMVSDFWADTFGHVDFFLNAQAAGVLGYAARAM